MQGYCYKPKAVTPQGNAALSTEAIFEPIPELMPDLLFPLNGAIESQTAGTKLVNNGQTHNGYWTSTPPEISYSTSKVIPSVFAPSKLRWAIQSTKSGVTKLMIDGKFTLTANGNGTAWASNDAALIVRVDGVWSWFEYELISDDTGRSITVVTPTGLIAMPSLYPSSAPTTPSVASGIKIKDLVANTEFIYKPGDLVKKSDIPTAQKSLYGQPVATLAELAALQGIDFEQRGCLEGDQLYQWKTTVDRLSTSFPGGRLPYVLDSPYPMKVGGWVPNNVIYCQLMDRWFDAQSLGPSRVTYARRLSTDEAINEVVFEYADPADRNVIGSVWWDDCDTWTNNDFWGGRTKMVKAMLSGGRDVFAVACIRDNGDLVLSSMNSAGGGSGSVRNVWINGIAADVEALLITDVVNKNKSQDASINKLSARNNPVLTRVDAGVAVAVGDHLRVQISTTNNRSLQISTSTATNVTVSWNGWHTVPDGVVNNSVTGQALTNAWTYINAGLTFSQQCQTQSVIIRDTTNNRRWRVDCNIGNNFTNSLFVVQELGVV